MFILKFFLVFLLFLVLMAFLMGATLFIRLIAGAKNILRQFTGQTSQDSKHRQENHGRTYGDNEKVIDTRSPQQASRKIFTEKEGEYVDFEEAE